MVSKKMHDMETKLENTLIKDLLQNQLSNNKMKLNDEAVIMMTELAQIMVVEAAQRVSKVTKQDNSSEAALNHIEMILPQLVMDFP